MGNEIEKKVQKLFNGRLGDDVVAVTNHYSGEVFATRQAPTDLPPVAGPLHLSTDEIVVADSHTFIRYGIRHISSPEELHKKLNGLNVPMEYEAQKFDIKKK